MYYMAITECKRAVLKAVAVGGIPIWSEMTSGAAGHLWSYPLNCYVLHMTKITFIKMTEYALNVSS